MATAASGRRGRRAAVRRALHAVISAFTPALLLAPPLGLGAAAQTLEAEATPVSDADWTRLAVTRLCERDSLDGLSAQAALPGSWLTREERRPAEGPPRRIRVSLILPGGGELRLERRQAQGRLRQFIVEHHRYEAGALRPNLQASADGGCEIRAGRRIREGEPPARFLEHLEGDLVTLRWTETLQAPWPPGADPGGARVGLVDSGLAYDLPLYAGRLARDEAGAPVGYDFWDDDPWPYDGDTARGPFLPIRHGSAVASVLVREAPEAALVPLRFPRPKMARMGALVEHAATAGVRILAMPLGSRRPEDWAAFESAMRANPQILAIVSAGNDGRDVDAAPLWPGALALENMIVATSADGFGRLAPGANWGARSVDLMVPAETVPVVDFRGALGQASGSSYAVPRLAALAARLLQAEPTLTATELRQRIFARAAPSPYERDGVVAVGWIPDPAQD